MVRRRTRALIQLGIAAIGLFAQMSLWRRLLNNVEEWDEPTRPSVFGLAAGALYQSADLWMHDRDVGKVRTNPYRRILFGICKWRLERWVFHRNEGFRENFGIGKTTGVVKYRLRYGLLHPLPGPDG